MQLDRKVAFIKLPVKLFYHTVSGQASHEMLLILSVFIFSPVTGGSDIHFTSN